MTEPDLRLDITPEPSDEEAAAVAAAIALLSAVRQPSPEPEPVRSPSRWALIGRLAAHTASPSTRQNRWSAPTAWFRHK